MLDLICEVVLLLAGTEAGEQPPARALELGNWHELVYDSRGRRVLLVNGGPETGKAAEDPLELWAWNGSEWTHLAAGAAGPRWRNFAAVAYDSKRGELVLYGGVQPGGAEFADTWEWNGERWRERSGDGPGPREAGSLAFDVARGRSVLFGGARRGTMTDETWEWDGEHWGEVAARGPAARFPAAFVHDEVRNETVLFGGHAIGARGLTTFGDTWTFDGSAWREHAVPGPSARDGARAVFEGRERRVLLFGGAEIAATVTCRADTWTWDGSRWRLLEAAAPPARVHPAMAYDAGRGEILLAGGSDAPSSVLRDVWKFAAGSWTCLAGCGD